MLGAPGKKGQGDMKRRDFITLVGGAAGRVGLLLEVEREISKSSIA